MNYLDYTEEKLKELGGYWTAKEIQQQPTSWARTFSKLVAQSSAIESFLQPILARDNLRIILTGAGTSAFIGSSLSPALSAQLGFRVEAIATTDLVSNPKEFFQKDTPTLLVSFARSGNSPESVAAVEYADQLVTNCYQLALTCNSDGALYKLCQGQNKFAFLMPEETNDQSLAMTSSFSSMLLSALYIFGEKEGFDEKLKATISSTESLITNHLSRLKEIASKQYERIIYLGSGAFRGLAQESALKLLELSDGKTISSYDSPLGFRHGPKAIVNEKTLVILFISNSAHTRKYDLDLLKELREEPDSADVIAISACEHPELTNLDSLFIESMADSKDVFLLFPYIVFAQAFAFEHAICGGNTPDNPSSKGTINRVVQGVTIHSL